MYSLEQTNRWITPLREAWSPVILEHFFAKLNGQGRPYLKLKGVVPGTLHLRNGEILNVVSKEGEQLLRTLAGIERRGSMHVCEGNTFDDVDYTQWPYMVGYSGSTSTLYPEMTIEQNLRYFAKQYQLTTTEVERAVFTTGKRLGLLPYFHLPVHQLPSVVARFVDLGCALIHDPKLLLLSDPTGLPPNLLNHYNSIVCEERAKGRSIVIASTTPIAIADRRISL